MRAEPTPSTPKPDDNRTGMHNVLEAMPGWVGPALIVIAVLLVMRNYAFSPRVSTEDVVRYWLPMYDFLGSSLRAGHIPAWNPFALGGTPFAADPQSGWMQVLPMILFTAFRSGVAIRWLVVIQPIIAGLGLYAFLRSEETSRSAATVGGLALALVIAASRLPVSIRFPGTLAWTAVSLAACSRYLRAGTTPGRIGWGVATALAWGQIAASHLTVGLLIGTGALLTFVLSKVLSNARQSSSWPSVLAGASLLVSLPLVNLAYLLPRLAFAPHTSLALGYDQLRELSLRLTGVPSPAFPGLAAGPEWPLDLATFPGRYLGAAALILTFGGFWSRRYRHLAVGFAVYGAGSYALGLRVVSHNLPSWIRSLPLIDQYLHEPYWVSFGLLLSLGVLAGIGVDAFREPRPARERLLMIVPAVVVWLALPIVVGAPASDLAFLVVAGLVTGAVLIPAVRRPVLLAILPVLLLAEILTTVALGSSRLPFRGDLRLLADLNRPTVAAAAYLTATPISRVLSEHEGARYYTMGLPTGRPYVDPSALQNNESMIQELENLGGYQAVQLQRYWLFVRTLQRQPMRYNYAIFVHPPPVVSDLLGVGWVIVGSRDSPGTGYDPVADDGRWTLYRRSRLPPRASFLTTWAVVRNSEAALQAVSGPGYDSSKTAVLEEEPGISQTPSTPAPASITYRTLGNQAARVDVEASTAGIVLVRNVWDRNWHATIDGREGRVIPTDYLVQGVPVGPGRHTILFKYDDPTVGYGLLGSVIVLVTLAGAAVVAWRRERRVRRGAVREPTNG